MDVVPIPAGSATPKKICIEMIGPDPSAGQNWTLQNWLDKFGIGARAIDNDSAFPQVYDVGTEEECDYNTFPTAYPFISPVQYEWSGSLQWEPGEYELTVTVKNSPDQHYPPDYIAAPSCTVLPVETVTGKVKVVLYKVMIDGVNGASGTERGSAETYTVTPKVDGMKSAATFTYNWESRHARLPNGGNTWSGEIDDTLTVFCDVVVRFPDDCFLIGGTTKTYKADQQITLVTSRTWDTPIELVERFPYRPDPSDPDSDIAAFNLDPCASEFGRFGITWAYPHRNGGGLAEVIASQLNYKEILSGPSTGRWFIQDFGRAKFRIDVNTHPFMYDEGEYRRNNQDVVAGQIACAEAHEMWHYDNDVATDALFPIYQSLENNVGDAESQIRDAALADLREGVRKLNQVCPGAQEHCPGAPPDPPFPGCRDSQSGPLQHVNLDGHYCFGDTVCPYSN